jgi:hypothetical protein
MILEAMDAMNFYRLGGLGSGLEEAVHFSLLNMCSM